MSPIDYQDKVQRISADPTDPTSWHLYEEMLQDMDWYYDYTDSHQVWETCDLCYSFMMRARYVLSQVDERRAWKLWKNYSPFYPGAS